MIDLKIKILVYILDKINKPNDNINLIINLTKKINSK